MNPISVSKILLGYDPVPENLLPALREISASFGWVSESEASSAADYFSLPLSRIYETASFYGLVKVRKESDISIRICSGTNCTVQGSVPLIREIENHFGIREGDSFNPRVKLEVISCLGRCGEGPVVVINGTVHERVTIGKLRTILESL